MEKNSITLPRNYIAADGKLMAVDVATSARFEHSVPHALIDKPFLNPIGTATRDALRWAPAPDEKRFLVVAQAEGTASVPITVVLNWQAALKR